MKKGDSKKKSGFTIIEVALVIAIAGLIFLMVFIALPQLQRQQRDSRRRDDILSFLETVKKYQTNNRGTLPKGTGEAVFGGTSTSDKNTWQDFYNDYWTNSSVDPDGNNYKLVVSECESSKGVQCKNLTIPDSMDHVFHIYVKATCENNENIVGTSNPRTIAVLYRMEGSGTYCANT
jgi:prepilin-type N-terminal cleavage/methylation domain-containing protein